MFAKLDALGEATALIQTSQLVSEVTLTNTFATISQMKRVLMDAEQLWREVWTLKAVTRKTIPLRSYQKGQDDLVSAISRPEHVLPWRFSTYPRKRNFMRCHEQAIELDL